MPLHHNRSIFITTLVALMAARVAAQSTDQHITPAAASDASVDAGSTNPPDVGPGTAVSPSPPPTAQPTAPTQAPFTGRTEAAPEEVATTAAPGKGFTIRAGDEFSMNVRARFQLRDTVSVASKTTNELNIRTARLYTQGYLLTPELRYTIQLALGAADFESSSSSPIFDAFIEYGALRDIQVRAGQYFVPFDRARTIREFALQLADRQQVVAELNLDRDVGLMLFSQDLFGLDGKLNYAVGVFGGSGRNRVGGEKPGFLYVVRIGYRPFGAFDDDVEGDLERLSRPRLALGIAGAYNQKTNRQRSTSGNTFELGTFNNIHGAADTVFKYAGFSFLGEVICRRSPRGFRTGVVEGENVTEWSRSGWGYLAQAGMMVTRMLEVAARWDELFTIPKTDPALVKLHREQGREAGGGLNLYLNGHLLKLQGDYAVRFGDDSKRATHLVRALLDATF